MHDLTPDTKYEFTMTELIQAVGQFELANQDNTDLKNIKLSVLSFIQSDIGKSLIVQSNKEKPELLSKPIAYKPPVERDFQFTLYVAGGEIHDTIKAKSLTAAQETMDLRCTLGEWVVVEKIEE